MVRVTIPKGSLSSVKNAKNTMPKMISGIMIGRVEMYSMMPLVMSLAFGIPTAARVPIIAARSCSQ